MSGSKLYKKLNGASGRFFRFQERHAFPCLCAWLVFIGIPTVLQFCEFVAEGGIHMIIMGAGIIFFVMFTVALMDWEFVKDKNDRVRFWKAWTAAFLAPILFFSATFEARYQSHTHQSEMKQATNSFQADMTSTNTFYSKKIEGLTNEIANLSSSLTIASNKLESEKEPTQFRNFLIDWAGEEFEKGKFEKGKYKNALLLWGLASNVETAFQLKIRLERFALAQEAVSAYLTNNDPGAGLENFRSNLMAIPNNVNHIDSTGGSTPLEWNRWSISNNVIPLLQARNDTNALGVVYEAISNINNRIANPLP